MISLGLKLPSWKLVLSTGKGDSSESESELISGFNLECSWDGFAFNQLCQLQIQTSRKWA
jgi:hypothetical protein